MRPNEGRMIFLFMKSRDEVAALFALNEALRRQAQVSSRMSCASRKQVPAKMVPIVFIQ